MANNIHREENDLVTLVDDQGNETLFQVLFTFQPDDSEKAYILLVPAGAEGGDEVDVFAFAYDPKEDPEGTEGNFFDIEDDAEWEMIEEVLETFLNDPKMQ